MLLKRTFILSLFVFTLLIIGAACDSPSPQPYDPMVVTLENPLGPNRTDFRLFIGDIIAGVMGVVGAITLGVFVAGGFMWLTSGGSQEKVSNGTKAMHWAVVGLFIIFASYAILNMVLKGIMGG